MKKLHLYNRTEEIFNELPLKYREIIFNNILARSVSNGKLAEEAELYIPSEEFLRIIEKLEISVLKQKNRPSRQKKRYIKNKEEELKEEKSKLFVY
jgi:hypothetical protein